MCYFIFNLSNIGQFDTKHAWFHIFRPGQFNLFVFFVKAEG